VLAATILLLAPALAGQSNLPKTDLDPALIALGQIRFKMAKSLQSVRNYTCAETVRRAQRDGKTQRRIEKRAARNGGRESDPEAASDFSDTVRLEVAVVDGAEIYSWPGGEFRAVPLGEIIGFGLAATGAFSSFAKSLFVTGQGQIHPAGQEDLGGRRVWRYDYRVPEFRSGYKVNVVRGSANVGYEGSFWADVADHQLTRITVRAVDIPPELLIRSVNAEIRYEKVVIGGEELTLASGSVSEMAHLDGSVSRNETSFHDCREFRAESELSFEPEPEPPVEIAPLTMFEAPVGTELYVKLASEISSDGSKVGDPFEVTLTRKASFNGRTVAEKGARLFGRVRRIHRVGRADDPFYAVSLELTELRSGNGIAAVRTELTSILADEKIARIFSPSPRIKTRRKPHLTSDSAYLESLSVEQQGDHGLAGAESFYVQGRSFRLLRGTTMTWRIVPQDAATSATIAAP
jgi:hypothetical protein